MFPLNKKIITALIVGLVIVGAAFYFGFLKDKLASLSAKQPGSGLVVENGGGETVSAGDVLQSDSDTDGLKYWEEVLWSTDPDNPDTDGDGTPDGQEVKENRSPLTPGPDDKMNPVSGGGEESGASGTSAEDSLTDTVAKSLYANYALLRESGNITEESQNKLTALLSNSVIQAVAPKTYAKEDLHVSKDETPSSIKKYGNDVAVIMKGAVKSGDLSEMIALTNYMSKNDPAELKKIVDSGDNYKKMLDNLLKLPVPPSAAEKHLVLVNGMSHLGRAIEGMAMIDRDPIVALISLQNYKDGLVKVVDALKSLILYFVDKKIVFTKEDNGYIFFRGI